MGFLIVKNIRTESENLALIVADGIRIYSSKDSTGNSDITISNRNFLEIYEVVGHQGDE